MPSSAQHPAFHSFGADQFAGVEIYDLIQDKNQHLLISSSDGVYRYDSRSYTKLQIPSESKSTSFYRMRKSPSGRVYCQNIYGEIYEIGADQLSLIFKLPPELNKPSMLYEIDGEDLIIAGKKLIRLKDGKYSILSKEEILFTSMIKTEHEILAYNHQEGNIIRLVDGEREVVASGKNGRQLLFTDSIGLMEYGKEMDQQAIYSFELLKYFPVSEPIRLIYPTKMFGFWAASSTKGVYLFDTNMHALFKGKRLFGEYFISAVYEDHEGNVILGTFDQGLLIVSHESLVQFGLAQKDTRYDLITSLSNGSVLAGDLEGNLWEFNKALDRKLIRSSTGRLAYYEFLEGTSLIIGTSTAAPSWIYDTLSKTEIKLPCSAIKDVTFLNEENFIISSNSGVYLWSHHNNHKLPFKLVSSKDSDSLFVMNYKSRTLSTAYNPSTQHLYLATAEGIMLMTGDSIKPVFVQGNVIISQSLCNWKNRIFAGTEKYGLLELRHGEVINRYGIDLGAFKSLIAYDSVIVSKTERSLLAFDPGSDSFYDLETIHTMNTPDEWTISDNQLFFQNKNQLYQTPLKVLSQLPKMPELTFGKFFVNDRQLESIDKLNHNQNKIAFEINCLTYKYKDKLKFSYRLVGLDNEPTVVSYNNNIIEYRSLPPGAYTFEVTPIYKDSQGQTIRISFNIRAPYWQKWWFYIFIALGIVMVLVFIFYIQIRKVKKRNKERLDQQIMEKNLVESQLQTLRSQMNPHFIFNSLNSLQELVLNQNVDETYDYISSFASLVRKTLDFSTREFITIGEEIEYLTVYLALEKLRFEDDFTYEINYSGDRHISLPTLIIQPFIENALQHGLLHKKGSKQLRINFELNNQNLTCVIEDNGVGRFKSNEINQRQKMKPNSFSTNAVTNRMDKLSQRYGQLMRYEILDLHENAKATGTRVTIFMSLKEAVK